MIIGALCGFLSVRMYYLIAGIILLIAGIIGIIKPIQPNRFKRWYLWLIWVAILVFATFYYVLDSFTNSKISFTYDSILNYKAKDKAKEIERFKIGDVVKCGNLSYLLNSLLTTKEI